jgi:hypothetical protein
MLFVSLDGANQILEALDGLKTGAPRAIVRSLNRAIGSAQTAEVKAIATNTGLKAKDVRSYLRLEKATLNRPVATLSASLKRIPRIDFNARGPEPSRGKGRGVSYAGEGGGRVTVADAFIATMASGHRGVFKRKGRSRLPIQELMGPSIGHVFVKYRPEAVARAREIFLSNFEHEISGAWNGTPVPSDDGSSDVVTA